MKSVYVTLFQGSREVFVVLALLLTAHELGEVVVGLREVANDRRSQATAKSSPKAVSRRSTGSSDIPQRPIEDAVPAPLDPNAVPTMVNRGRLPFDNPDGEADGGPIGPVGPNESEDVFPSHDLPVRRPTALSAAPE